MSHSVKITTPIPSPEEIASDLGIKGRRLHGLLELVDGSKKNGTAYGPIHSRSGQVKNAAKKAPAKRAPGKHGRSAR